MWREHKVRDLKGLAKALDRGTIDDARMKSAVADLLKGPDRLPLAVVKPIIDEIVADLNAQDYVVNACAAGSVRRKKETVKDCDVIVAVHEGDEERIVTRFLNRVKDTIVVNSGTKKARILIPLQGKPFQVDLLVVHPEEWGSALNYFTGSKEHNVRLRSIAKARGMKVSEHGIFRGDVRIGGEEEEDLYEILGIPYVEPEQRNE